VKKLRFFVFKGVADELENPAEDKQPGGKHPERMEENGRDAERQRRHDQRNANAMAQPVDWMGMAACILRDPLFAGASAKHARIITDVSTLERNSRYAGSRNMNESCDLSITVASAGKPSSGRRARGCLP
jgi:hypothetical protein